LKARRPAAALLPAASYENQDIVRRFLAWAQRADAERRAQAASALARAYLHPELTPPTRAEAAIAMTALLDDPAALVRRALAEALAGANEAPRHLVIALAWDQSDIAAPVLQRSPLLTDADLVDCAASADVAAQSAVARRSNLSPGISAALAEVGQREAILTLVGNRDAALRPCDLHRILERFGDDGEVREALLRRPSSPASIKACIAVATALDLGAAAKRWLPSERAERVARQGRDRAICSIASSCPPGERRDLVRSLRQCGAITPALLLRSLLGGEREFFAEALAELSGLPAPRAMAFALSPRGQGFAALARRAGLKINMLPAFQAALAAIEPRTRHDGEGLKLPLVQVVIDECEARHNPALAKVLALLWRFAAEAARAEAASFARKPNAGAAAARLPQSLDFWPANDDVGDTLMLTMDSEALSTAKLALKTPEALHSAATGESTEPPIELIATLDDAA
jgi:uncharacterized protein (DUF2336 family)